MSTSFPGLFPQTFKGKALGTRLLTCKVFRTFKSQITVKQDKNSSESKINLHCNEYMKDHTFLNCGERYQDTIHNRSYDTT